MRVIINGSAIYQLEENRSIVIPLANWSTIVVTDGFHFTKPFHIASKNKPIYYFTIVCAIDDDRLLAGSIVTILFFLVGLTSGIIVARMVSFMPILYFLYLYYINRKDFIQIKSTAKSR